MQLNIVKDNDFSYYQNLIFLQENLRNDQIHFQGNAEVFNPDAYNFRNGRVWDFVRAARARIGKEMVANLNGALPGLTAHDRQHIREFFNCAFNYYAYKGHLNVEGNQHGESLKMFVFHPAQQYVAHVNFSSHSRRGPDNLFVVNISVTCQLYNFFEPQNDDIANVIQAIQNLHVN